jgi:hypothetical protein
MRAPRFDIVYAQIKCIYHQINVNIVTGYHGGYKLATA